MLFLKGVTGFVNGAACPKKLEVCRLVDLCMGTRIDTCMDMCVGMHIDTCLGMCMDMCVRQSHVHRYVHRHMPRHLLQHEDQNCCVHMQPCWPCKSSNMMVFLFTCTVDMCIYTHACVWTYAWTGEDVYVYRQFICIDMR